METSPRFPQRLPFPSQGSRARAPWGLIPPRPESMNGPGPAFPAPPQSLGHGGPPGGGRFPVSTTRGMGGFSMPRPFPPRLGPQMMVGQPMQGGMRLPGPRGVGNLTAVPRFPVGQPDYGSAVPAVPSHIRRQRKVKSIWRRILESKPNEFRCIKMLIEFPIGLVLGFVLYKFVLARLYLSGDAQLKLALYFILFFSIAYSLFTPFRCMTWLLAPTMFSVAGRIYVFTFLISAILTGPLNTMLLNGQEVGHSITCTFFLATNQTKTYFALQLVPIIDIVTNLENNAWTILEKCREFAERFIPFNFEVEDKKETFGIQQETEVIDGDLSQDSRSQKINSKYSFFTSRIDKFEKFYRRKLDFRCHDIFNYALNSCKNSFKTAGDKCWRTLPFIINTLLCWPLKLDFLCNIVKIFELLFKTICNTLDGLSKGFGESFTTARKIAETLDQDFIATIAYMIDEGEEQYDKFSAMEASMIVDNQIRVQTATVTTLLALVDRLMIFVFVFVIHSAHKYQIKFLSDIYHDNIYISSYFRHVDDRRAPQGKRTLLPLKKLEEKEIVYPLSFKMSDEEFTNLFNGTITVVIRGISVAFLLFFDRLFYEVLDMLARHARIDFHQSGKHHIALTMSGTGVIVDIFNAIFRGFNATHVIDNYTSTKECLPKPVRTTTSQIVAIYLVLLYDWLVVLFSSYGLRFRPLICGFFFRKREKQRVLTLYNDMARRREGFLQHARRRVRREVQNDIFSVQFSIWTTFRFQFPTLCACLGWCGIGLQACFICGDPENITFIHCPTPKCKGIYCRQCFADVHYKCYACRDEDDWSIENPSESSEDD